ncbi:folylpolyglutamate synthase, mitochondrial isoform X2 [Anthonomus grandis grandis]|uniref:folylpolyglutamate synthase, mitochondrial isoform X2 n=1 Tax=Anthonomus grandis grandis TaxID=2921223 RepID=UPI0021663C87|nr:folylpolyglutamate synthase, mitochondrial isoform X2 [Anthonomus grandis grandis]
MWRFRHFHITFATITTKREISQEAIDTLNRLQSNVEYIKHAKVQNNQENNMVEMHKFLKRSGMSLEQLDSLPVIHIAGTNGKGTTCSYCESILRHHGYKTGFYSSPHLLEVRERIRLNGVPISKDKFSEYFWKIYNRLDKEKSASYDMPLYFRFLTLMALHVFVSEKVDVAILEVGIGGEYDCTNIIRKTLVAGITPLDIDHTTLLGNTIESIAWNKAGIMKPDAQVFTAPQPEAALKVLKQRSIEKNATLEIIKNVYTEESNSGIPRQVRKTNASLALAISKAFMTRINNNNLSKFTEFNLDLAKKCIETARWPGRYEIIPRKSFTFYLDGAHTVDSMQVCSDWFLSKTKETNRRVLVFNVTGERDPENLLKLLVKCQFDVAVFIPNVGDDNDSADQEDQIQPVKRQLERCHLNKQIWTSLDGKSAAEVLPSFAKTVNYLQNQSFKETDVLITGSIHLIGSVMSVLDPTLGGSL